MSLKGWSPQPLLPVTACRGGILFVDAAFDVDQFKIGVWGPALGGSVFKCSSFVATQQEAELEAGVRGVCL